MHFSGQPLVGERAEKNANFFTIFSKEEGGGGGKEGKCLYKCV